MTKQRESSQDCRFCQILNGLQFNGAVDMPISANSDYISMASIGAIIEGWSLIIPKTHCLSLRDYYGNAEFSQFVKSVVNKIELAYGPTVIFEHGANHTGSLTSCGTDHAHLHVVPLQFSLNMMLGNSGVSDWPQVRASEISSLALGGEYLFFSEKSNNEDPIGYFKKIEQPSSQFFRKAIAAVIGKTSIADYKTYPLLSESVKTRERLALAA